MKRVRIPGLLDLLVAESAEEIEQLVDEPRLDRAYVDRSLLLNGYVLARLRKTLQIGGEPFPTVSARDAPGRAASQSLLWTRLNGMTQHFASGPDELENLAAFVRGERADAECGPLVQQVVGRLFAPDFEATAASWKAALVLAKAPRTMNPVLLAWWAATRRIDRAKELLATMVGGDLAGVHAVGIALHNIVPGVMLLRQLFRDPVQGCTLSAEAASAQCLFAPDSVLRQPTGPVLSARGTLTTETLLLIKLQAANLMEPNGDVVFLRRAWSRCPAESWVPALLEGIWRRARSLPVDGGSSATTGRCPFPSPRTPA